MAGIPLYEDIAPGAGVPQLNTDAVHNSHSSALGHGSAQLDASELGKCGTRIRLTDGEKLLLVQLCIQHGEEYLGRKEVFWTKRTAEILQRTGKRIGNARSTVTDLLQKFKMEVAAVC